MFNIFDFSECESVFFHSNGDRFGSPLVFLFLKALRLIIIKNIRTAVSFISYVNTTYGKTCARESRLDHGMNLFNFKSEVIDISGRSAVR